MQRSYLEHLPLHLHVEFCHAGGMRNVERIVENRPRQLPDRKYLRAAAYFDGRVFSQHRFVQRIVILVIITGKCLTGKRECCARVVLFKLGVSFPRKSEYVGIRVVNHAIAVILQVRFQISTLNRPDLYQVANQRRL